MVLPGDGGDLLAFQLDGDLLGHRHLYARAEQVDATLNRSTLNPVGGHTQLPAPSRPCP
jgi:hypothetical protein